MPQSSFALLTNRGRQKEAAALANGTAVVITHIAIGDGATVPSGGETQLYHEVARKTISGKGVVSGAPTVAYADIYLAAADGPYTIREAGLIDQDGELIAIAHYDPPIAKPTPDSGQTVEGTIRLEVAFTDLAAVTIKVDPSMAVALQRLSVLPWIPVLSVSTAAPPASPAFGDTYVIPAGATGSWSSHANKIAEYTAAGWAIITPKNGTGVGLPDGRVFVRIAGVFTELTATEARRGLVELATAAEALAGTDSVRSVTPRGAVDVRRKSDLVITDGGTSAAMTATMDPAPPSLYQGLSFKLRVQPAQSGNAGAVTLNLNGLGAVPIVPATTPFALTGGEIDSNALLDLIYQGTSFVAVSGLRATEGNEGVLELATPAEALAGTLSTHALTPAGAVDVRRKFEFLAIATGTANTVTATLVPAPASLFVGLSIRLRFGAGYTGNTGPVTLNLNGNGAAPVYSPLSPFNLAGGEILPNSVLDLVYEGSGWVAVAGLHATETIKGVVELATPAETAAMADGGRAVTPLGLKQQVRKVAKGLMVVFGPGSTSWVCPDDVTLVRAYGRGGGGGGGGSTNATFSGSGGSGAAYFDGVFTVVPGTSYSVVVGAGGTAGNGAGGNGGLTSFGAFASAPGGIGAPAATASPVATNGPGSGSGGQVNMPGGVGGRGGFSTDPSPQGGVGGGSFNISALNFMPVGPGQGIGGQYPGLGGNGAGGTGSGGNGGHGGPGQLILEY